MYFITLTELSTKSDLKAVVGAISNVLHVDKKTAVEYAKNLPLELAQNLPEKEARLMAEMFIGMGAGVKVNPPLDDLSKVYREFKTQVPRKGIPLGCLAFIIACLVGFAVFAAVNHEWIIEQFKPSPKKSEKLLQKGNMEEARKTIKEQLKEKPDDIELLILQGKFYIGAARKNMDAQKWETYGEAGAMPEVDSAITFFRQAESLDSKNGEIPRWISVAEQMRGSLSDAEVAARRAVAISPESADNWNQLGSVLTQMKKAGQAEKTFYNALKIEPNNAAALKNLAILNLYYTQDAGRASKFLFTYLNQKEAETDMDSHLLRTDLASAMFGDFNPPLEKLGPPPLPFEEFEKRRLKIAGDPNLKIDPVLQEQMGLLFMSKGDMKTAEAYFIKAVQLNANTESSRKMLAIIYMRQPNWEKALTAMQAATDNGSKDAFFWKNIGFLQKYYKANIVEAGKAWNRYFALGGDSYEKRVREEAK